MIEVLVELLMTFLIVHAIARALIHGTKQGKRNELSVIFPARKEKVCPEIKAIKRNKNMALDEGGYLYRCIGKPADVDTVEHPSGFAEMLVRKRKRQQRVFR
ncbi:uncharacterized protein LOC108738554 [Agrilus planipennis]|uniref:Uncharacterized protein LOC108738554 n=1 Tax=Agrilus planipennis TaxID=224129 RepID=A0A1W4X5B5_AGRPL|nr:uncharacterized protein LOC108738554 [Agrilus planipennis]